MVLQPCSTLSSFLCSVGSQGEIGKNEWLNRKVLQQGTVDLGQLEVQSGEMREAKNVTTKTFLLCFGVVVVAEIADAFEVGQIEGIIDANVTCMALQGQQVPSSDCHRSIEGIVT